MKQYHLDTKFTFGKFTGMTVREVLIIHPYYIEWCAFHLEHFYIDIQEIKALTEYNFRDEVKAHLEKKMDDYAFERQAEAEWRDYQEMCRRETFYALTDGQCGSYKDDTDIDDAMDYMGY